MITKDQALTANEFHEVLRQGDKTTCVRWRRNGKTQTWKRNLTAFRIPVKHGLYAYGQITPENAQSVIPVVKNRWHISSYIESEFYTAEECPLCNPTKNDSDTPENGKEGA